MPILLLIYFAVFIIKFNSFAFLFVMIVDNYKFYNCKFLLQSQLNYDRNVQYCFDFLVKYDKLL